METKNPRPSNPRWVPKECDRGRNITAFVTKLNFLVENALLGKLHWMRHGQVVAAGVRIGNFGLKRYDLWKVPDLLMGSKSLSVWFFWSILGLPRGPIKVIAMSEDPKTTLESLSAEIGRLRTENENLKEELEQVAKQRSRRRDFRKRFVGFLGRVFFGRKVLVASANLSNQTKSWQAGTSSTPLVELQEWITAIFMRFVRISIYTLLLALIPAAVISIQTWALLRQNTILLKQSEIADKQAGIAGDQKEIMSRQGDMQEHQTLAIDRDIALSEFEQAMRIRELLIGSAMKRTMPNAGRFGKDEDEVEVFEPSTSIAKLVSNLARTDRIGTASILVALLGEWDGKVSGGALLALRNIFQDATDVERKELVELFPRDWRDSGDYSERPVRLIGIYMRNEDLAPLADTGILRNGAIVNCYFDDVDLDEIDLAGTVISNCDFVTSRFHSSDMKYAHINNCHLYWSSFDNSRFKDTFFWKCEFRGIPSNTSGPDEMAGEPFKSVNLSGAHFHESAFFDSRLSVQMVTKNRFDKCAFFYSRPEDMPSDLSAMAEASPSKYALINRDGEWLNVFAQEVQRDDWRDRGKQKDGIESLFKQLVTEENTEVNPRH